jgi:hypothetical protein|tara:strand:- start:2312 stop:2506 length:195 start_codon:yes stop_codon:yes gene_type:complete
MYEIITPPYEVVEIYVAWINECADMVDAYRIKGDIETAKLWEEPMMEAQNLMVDYVNSLRSRKT